MYNHYRNVALFIANDDWLYHMAKYHIWKCRHHLDEAAAQMMAELRADGIKKTPDGARYSTSAIRAAMVGL